MTFTYADLIDRNGRTDAQAFAVILGRNIAAETNLSICAKARLSCPSYVRPGDARDWYAEQAARIGNNLTVDEHRRIWAEQRRLLAQLTTSMLSARVEADRQIAAENQAA